MKRQGRFFCMNAVEKQAKGSGLTPDFPERFLAADGFPSLSPSPDTSLGELVFIMPNTRIQSYMVDLSRNLLELHQALVQAARKEYEKDRRRNMNRSRDLANSCNCSRGRPRFHGRMRSAN
jgi:hypothetical protein